MSELGTPTDRARVDVVAELTGYRPLADASPADRAELAGLLRPDTARAGAVLIRRGDAAGSFLLLTAGSVRVEVRNDAAGRVCVVPAGSVVGEIALLRGTAHRATVTALTDVRFLAGDRQAFGQLLRIPGVGDRLVRAARQRVAAGVRPVPLSLHDGTTVEVRPVVPDDRRPVLEDSGRSSRDDALPAVLPGRVALGT